MGLGFKKRIIESIPAPAPQPLLQSIVEAATPTNIFLAGIVILLTMMIFSRFGKEFMSTNLSVGLMQVDSGSASKARKSGGWPEYRLLSKKNLSGDTMRLKFAIPEKGVTSLPAGKHIMCRAMVNGERVVRPYTPTHFDAEARCVDLVVKVYDQAKMSSHLHALSVGDACEMFGPVGSLKYRGGSFDRLVFFCAGTGITPVYAFASSVLNDPQDSKTALVILYQNRYEEDVLLRDELLVLAAQARQKQRSLTLVFACSRAGPDFVAKSSGGVSSSAGPPLATHVAGYLDEALVAPHIPRLTEEAASGGGHSGDDRAQPRTKVFLCGPGGFNAGITKICASRGYGGDSSEGKERFHLF